MPASAKSTGNKKSGRELSCKPIENGHDSMQPCRNSEWVRVLLVFDFNRRSMPRLSPAAPSSVSNAVAKALIGLVDVPASANLAAAMATQAFRQCWREFGFPVADRLVTEHDAADQEHLRQVAQAEVVAQAPEHHEGDDVRGILRPI